MNSKQKIKDSNKKIYLKILTMI